MQDLLIALLICHYLADFCLTSHGMVAAKAKGKPLLPILGHAAVHSFLMGITIFIFNPNWKICLSLMAIQLFSHFFIDTTKGLLTAGFPTLADNTRKPFWMLFGMDQMLHILVIIFMTELFFSLSH